MNHLEYVTCGTCSRLITIDVDAAGIIRNLSFLGGCSGNLQGISKLIVGMKVEDAISRLRGIDCSGRGTSCPDQLSIAMQELLDSEKEN